MEQEQQKLVKMKKLDDSTLPDTIDDRFVRNKQLEGIKKLHAADGTIGNILELGTDTVNVIRGTNLELVNQRA
jgi:hypothetical protein